MADEGRLEKSLVKRKFLELGIWPYHALNVLDAKNTLKG